MLIKKLLSPLFEGDGNRNNAKLSKTESMGQSKVSEPLNGQNGGTGQNGNNFNTT